MSKNNGDTRKNILVFGASGSIGSHILQRFRSEKEHYHCIGTTSKSRDDQDESNDPPALYHVSIYDHYDTLNKFDSIDGIVWAQGYNCNDNIYNFSGEEFITSVQVNIRFIMTTLSYLLKNNKIRTGAKMVIISSIMENITRENKLSYTITKSALSGLVKNLSYDLAKTGILINNVLPGVIDNPMTRQTLTSSEMTYLQNYMPFERLVSLDDVFNTVKFLLIENTGITGQSITVDLGFSNIRKYS